MKTVSSRSVDIVLYYVAFIAPYTKRYYAILTIINWNMIIMTHRHTHTRVFPLCFDVILMVKYGNATTRPAKY